MASSEEKIDRRFGNDSWKLRSKHGRDRIIQDPKALEESAIEYFTSCENDPIYTVEYKGNPPEKCEIPHQRVFLKEGLLLFIGVAKWETIESLKEVSDDFLDVITRIEQIIKTQKFSGAASGVFNQSIIAQDLGLNTQRIIVNDQRKTIDELFPEEDKLNEQGNQS
jgi:hypothetical protein